MPLFRGLILLLAIWLAIVLARQLYRSHRRKQMQQTRSTRQPLDYTPTVACAYCRTHTPKTEAFHQDGRYFCDKSCYQQDITQQN